MPKQNPEAEEPKVDILGQLSVRLGGAEYVLRPSRQAISNVEKLTGKALPQLAVQCGSMALTVVEMGIAVAEMMRAYSVANPEASANYRAANADVCADHIYEAGPVDVARRLAVILTGALTGGYTASGEVKAVGTMTTEPTPTAE